MATNPFLPGEIVYALNAEHQGQDQGVTGLRIAAEENAAFSGLWVPDDSVLEIIEVKEHFLKVKRPNSEQEGWIEDKHITRTQAVKATKEIPSDRAAADPLASTNPATHKQAEFAGPTQLGPGSKIKDFIVERQIGSGGMGEVFGGYHAEIKKRAAIKVLHPRYASNEVSVSRFLQEARAVNEIHHDNIVDIFDFGRLPDQRPFFIMEFLDGKTLSDYLKEKVTLPFSEMLKLLEQVCEALQAAHDKGIIHRDLKPENIFLVLKKGSYSFVKVLDFGIAKLSKNPNKPEGESLTHTGAVMGTSIYMSPEQCRGAGEVDHRTDIYALGIILFEMLTGRTPFYEKGDGPGDIISKHINQLPPAASSMVSGRKIPKTVENFLHGVLSKSPSGRPSQCKFFFSELEKAIGDHKSETNDSIKDAKPIFKNPSNTKEPAVSPSNSGDYITGDQANASANRGNGMLIGLSALALLSLALGYYFFFAQPDVPPSSTQTTVTATKPTTIEAQIKTAGLPEKIEGFVAIEPSQTPVVLGVTANKPIPDDVWGFRPERKVSSPLYRYFLQEHEVTWGEIDPWLARHSEIKITKPSWAKNPSSQNLPATSIPWEAARLFCAETFDNGDLPTEEEWEYAARGQELRAYAWGSEAIDATAQVYKGPKATPVAVMSSKQDKTPSGIYDLMGNVQEWTFNVWTENETDEVPLWAQQGNMSFRVVRGLPLGEKLKSTQSYPKEGAAYRDRICATGNCEADPSELMMLIGFRCAIKKQ
jgi:serine/threonine protein kinase